MSKSVLCLGLKPKCLVKALTKLAKELNEECFLIVGLSSKCALGFVVSAIDSNIYLAENYGTAANPAVTISEKLVGLPKGLLKSLQNKMRNKLSEYSEQLARVQNTMSPQIMQHLHNFLNQL